MIARTMIGVHRTIIMNQDVVDFGHIKPLDLFFECHGRRIRFYPRRAQELSAFATADR